MERIWPKISHGQMITRTDFPADSDDDFNAAVELKRRGGILAQRVVNREGALNYEDCLRHTIYMQFNRHHARILPVMQGNNNADALDVRMREALVSAAQQAWHRINFRLTHVPNAQSNLVAIAEAHGDI